MVVSSFPYAINWSGDHVPAILHITQSSQELGNGLADVLFGKVSPAGRLVQTWSKAIEDLGPMLEYNIRNGKTYQYNRNEPLFPFGHGLTYTSFLYSDLKMNSKALKDGEILQVNFKLKNTGNVDSDEVVQLYVSFPDSKVERPVTALKAFKRVFVPAGKTIDISLPLNSEELRYWNAEKHAFVLEPGRVDFFVGSSSADVRLKGKFDTK